MNETYEPDDATLHAYVDDQLDAEARRAVMAAMNRDEAVRERVCRLRSCKDWVKSGFDDAQPPGERPLPARLDWCRLGSGIAAAFALVAVGLMGGVAGYYYGERDAVAVAPEFDPNHVVLHIDENDPARFKAALDYAENFLARDDGAGAMEVLVNAGGLDLVRSGVSPFEDRVRALSERYRNLQFVACANSIRKLRSEGIEPKLIAATDHAETAVEHVARRIKEGWTYRRVDTLPPI